MNKQSSDSKEELNKAKKILLEPLAIRLIDSVKWLNREGY